MSKKKAILVILFFLIVHTTAIFAQPCDGPDCGGDVDVPLSGIEWLLLAGGALGVRKLYLNRKRSRGK